MLLFEQSTSIISHSTRHYRLSTPNIIETWKDLFVPIRPMQTTLTLSLLLCVACSPRGVQPPTQLDQAVVGRLPAMMQAYGVEGMTVVAVSGQETLLSVAYGQTKDGQPFTTDTACPIYSATKVLTSLTIASMVEDDEFDVNTALGEHLTDAPSSWATIPFWRLLNHSSGITMIVSKPIFEELSADPEVGNVEVYNIVRELPLDYNPGEYSRYRQSGYSIAEMILTAKFDTEWPDLVAQHITRPANAPDTVYRDMFTDERKSPLLSSAGGFQTTSKDMANIFKTLNLGEIVSPGFLEQWLYDDTYNFDGYSLGSVLVDVEGMRTLGHSGGGRANIRYAPEKGVGVMVCTDDTSNNNIMHDVANMLIREIAVGEATLMPIQTLLHSLKGATAKQIIAAYQTAKSASPQTYVFSGSENSFNQIGYNLLGGDKTSEAIEIFQFNVLEHPQSANAHDSLGEALFSAGKFEASLKSYNKVLELDTNNENAQMMIDKINSKNKE